MKGGKRYIDEAYIVVFSEEKFVISKLAIAVQKTIQSFKFTPTIGKYWGFVDAELWFRLFYLSNSIQFASKNNQ